MKISKTQTAPKCHGRQTARPAFISQILVWSLLIVGIAGASGVSVVWQRQLIAQTSNRLKTLENNIAEVQRHQSDITSELAAEQSLDALLRRNAAFALNLAPIREQQLIRVTIDPARRLATKRNAETYAIRN